MSARLVPLALALALVPVIAGAAFSFYQTGSRLFVCGRDMAGGEIYAWLALAALQGLLYLLATRSEPSRRLYRASQAVLLVPLAIVAGQLALAYPRIFIVVALGALAYGMAVAGVDRLRPARHPRAFALVPALAETTAFVLAAAVIHSIAAFVVLYTPGQALDDRTFLLLAGLSALVAGVLVRRERAAFDGVSFGDIPPLALLLLVLLRAKLPDLAYDSLFYKATLPILVADWRTALTGVFDHSLVGTNLLEILNAQARIVDRDFSPAIGGTLAAAALWVIAPVSARAVMPASLGPARGFAAAACALAMVSLTEPLIAAGTAYHEPMLALLMAAALLPIAPAWLFLGAAIAAKITVVFAAPVLVLARIAAGASGERSPVGSRGAWAGGLEGLKRLAGDRPVAFALCLALGAFAIGQQLDRNLAQTGRLLAVTEILSGVTDPEGRVLLKQDRNAVFDAVANRGPTEKYGNTFVHVLTLDRFIAPTELGFHVMPTSRLIAVAAILALLAPLIGALRRDALPLAALALWLACVAAALNYFSQGRHLFPMSFAAAIVVPWAVGTVLRETSPRGGPAVAACLAFAALAAGDQAVGSFINNGWECRRPLRAPVVMNDYDRPVTPLEQRLAEIAAQYRAKHAPGTGDPPPTILCESPTERMRYLGVHYVYAFASFDLTRRRLAARPDEASLVPTSLLAVCFANAAFFEDAVPAAQRRAFSEVPGVGNIRIFVSDALLRGERATSLAGTRVPAFGALASPGPTEDFVAGWASGRLTDHTPVDAPGGKGAFLIPGPPGPAAVLISPFGVEFANVRFREGSRLEIEAAMPYANSDGMTLRITAQVEGGKPHVATLDLPPRRAASAEPEWRNYTVPLPPDLKGEGRLRLEGNSPNGNSIADWAYVRHFRLEPGSR